MEYTQKNNKGINVASSNTNTLLTLKLLYMDSREIILNI